MKTHLLLLILTISLSTASAQNNNPQLLSTAPPRADISYKSKTGMTLPAFNPANLVYNCETVFWTVNDGGEIKQWDLIGNQVTGGTVVASGSISGLAFCSTHAEPNNLTFYGAGWDSSGFIEKFNGTSGWSTIDTSIQYTNNGGYYQHQFYRGNDFNTLYYYNGTTFTQLANFSTTQIVIADIAVDSFGRAWVFTGSMTTGVSNFLRTYNSSGPITMYTVGQNIFPNYGAFFINDQLYISKGDTIVPINIAGSTATLGTPILFPDNNYYDMASCNKVQTLGTHDPELQNLISVYPNPTENTITVNTTTTVSSVHIYSVDGKLLKTVTNSNIIDLSNLAASTYFIKIITPDNVYNKSIIKK